MRVLRVLGVFLLGTCIGLVVASPFGAAEPYVSPAVGGLVAGAATRKPALGALLGLAVGLLYDVAAYAMLVAMMEATNARAAAHGMAAPTWPSVIAGPSWLLGPLTGAAAGAVGSYAWGRIAQARAAKRRA